MADSILDNPVFGEILQRYVNEAERVFRREVAAQGLVLTSSMLNSIRSSAVERGQGFVQGAVHYNALLRLKDMRQLNYTRMPPFAAMVKFVEAVGPDQFPHVPGYPDGMRPASYTVTVERIAAVIMRYFRREPNVRRGYRGVYNDPLKNTILPEFFEELRQHAGATALTELRLQFRD
jgi:hypothetical protein